MNFTQEQELIKNAEINNNLVSASAGSGKTTVLTARIGAEISDRKLSVDSMLVVTFTEDAAAHMADKIEEKLRELRKDAALKGDAEQAAYLSEQIDLLPNAYIQTMHGFCSRVIKEKGYLIADNEMADFTDPTCRIISESELKILLQSAIDSAIKELYSGCTSYDDPFIRFTRRFGDGRDDSNLSETVFKTYLSLRSLPDYIKICNDHLAKREKLNADGKIMSDEDFEDLKHTVEKCLLRIKDAFGSSEFASVLEDHKTYRMTKDLTNDEFISKVITETDAFIEASKNLSETEYFRSVRSMQASFDLNYSKMFAKADLQGDDKPFCAYVAFRRIFVPGSFKNKDYNNSYDLPDAYRKLFLYDTDEVLVKQKEGTEAVRQFVRLLTMTDKHYLKIKTQMHGMDFSDLEHTAYEILKNGSNGEKSEAAVFYGDKFKEIFVDEYQDNTNLQDEIINCFMKDNVFRVGDIKQSIYKFRYADPTIFKGRMIEYASGEKGKVFYLRENHRSSCKILAFANYIFDQIMSGDATEIEYDDDQRLRRASESEPGVLPRIVIADKGESSVETVPDEASEDAGLPEDLSDDGEEDKTDSEYRAIFAAVESEVKRYLEDCKRLDGTTTDFSDICILTSSNKQAERIARYLNKCSLKDGRKIVAAGRFTTDVFEDMDIHRLINLMICLGNEYRDEYLACVLFSNYKFSNFTVEELARIQVFIHEMDGPSLEKEPLMLRLRIFAEKNEGELADRVNHFISVFDKLRMNSMVSDIDDIIEQIYRETDIKATLKARTGDGNKFDVFKDWLSESFKRRGADISGIAEELEKMKIQIKKADIEVTDADKNKITTMTVHKSKGLEFPFVILIANGGSDERKDSLESMIFNHKEGFITEDYYENEIKRTKSFEQYVYQTKMDLATTAETCRLLYVALTRAEEYLSVITVTEAGNTDHANPMRSAFIQAFDCEDTALDRRHWLAGNMKLPYCLFSALARSADGDLMRDVAGAGKLRRNAIPFRDLDGKVDKGFDVVYMDPDEVAEIYGSHKTDEEEPGKAVTGEKPEFDEEGKLVFPEYKYQESVDVPFKVSVTGITGDKKPSDTTHVDLQIRSVDDFESVNVSMLTGAAKGTILHRIMRFIDLEAIRSGAISFELEIESMINGGYLNICSADQAREVASEFREGITAFCSSDRCGDIIKSFADGSARSEKPIVFSVFINGDEGDSALVQGMIDLIYKTDEGYTILDYKTDRLDGVTPEDRAKEALERHAFQLNSYAAACEEDGLKVAHKLLYLVRYGEFVEV